MENPLFSSGFSAFSEVGLHAWDGEALCGRFQRLPAFAFGAGRLWTAPFSGLTVLCAPLAGRGPSGGSARAVRSACGAGGLWTVPFWRRALPCGSVFGADRAMRSVRGAGRLRTAPFLEVPGFRFRCGDALDGSFSGQAVPCVSFAVWRSFRRLCPCRAAKRRNGGRRVGR